MFLFSIPYIYIYIYIYKVTATSLQEKAIYSILQKAPLGMHMATQAKFIISGTAIHVTRKRTVFGIDVNPMYSHMPSQTCCRPTYFNTELTQITCKLLRKDLCNISQWLFAVMRSHITRKSKFGQTLLQMLQTCSDWKVSRTLFYLMYIYIYINIWLLCLLLWAFCGTCRVCFLKSAHW